jgi:hypothetical protein
MAKEEMKEYDRVELIFDKKTWLSRKRKETNS